MPLTSIPRSATPRLRLWLVLASLAVAAASCRKPPPPPAPTGPSPAESAAALGKLTDKAPVRLAWLEGAKLYYYDSVQPAPPRVLRTSPSQERPVFTPDGAALLINDAGKILALTLPAGESQELGSGFAFAAVRTAESHEDWVYAADSAEGNAVVRFPLRSPEKREQVWNAARLDPRTAQASRDGLRLSGAFFGITTGTADVRDGLWTPISARRPIALAPDASHIAAMLDGTGRRFRFFHPSGEPWNRESDDLSPPARWKAEIPTATWSGPEARFTDARWSNHPQFLALTETGRPGPARLALARLSPAAAEIEALAVVAAAGPDVRGLDAWVGGGATASMAEWPASPPSHRPVTEDANGVTIAWPRTLDGVSFVWNTRHHSNQLPSRQSPCQLIPRGTARFGEWGDMLLDGGTFEANDESARAVAAAASAANRFVLQLFLSESIEQEGPLSTRLAGLQLKGDRDAFSLSRVDHALVFRVLLDAGDGSAPREYQSSISPLAITPGQPFHLMVEFTDNTVIWTVDGQQVGAPQKVGPGTLAAWKPDEVTRLVIGDDATKGTTGWRARLEKVLILTRVVDYAELRENRTNASASTDRRLGSVVRVRAKLIEAPPIPSSTPASPVLVQQLYHIEEVLSGQIKVDPLPVWHWAVLDGKPAASRPGEIGKIYELRLSPLIRHPEVELEATILGPERLTEPGYLDVAAPQSPPTLSPFPKKDTDEIAR